MDIQNIIMQGGALAVILLGFLWLLQFLLGHFTRCLARIEKAQYATTLAIIGVTRLLFRVSINHEDLTDAQTIQLVNEVNDQLKQIEHTLVEMKDEGRRK